MKKLRFPLFLPAIAILALSCHNPVLTAPKNANSPSSKTLSAQIVDEWAAAMASSPTAKALVSSSRALLATDQVGSLKIAAIQKIAAGGKTDSTNMDEIMPLLIEGIQAGMANASSGLSSSDMVNVMQATTTALVASAGKSGRETSVSAKVSVSAVVGIVASEAASVVMEQLAKSSPELSKAAVSFIVGAAIDGLQSASSLDTSAERAEAISAVVSKVTSSVIASVDTSSSTGYVAAIGSSASAAVVDVLSDSADRSAAAVAIVTAVVKAADSSNKLSSDMVNAVVAGVSQSGVSIATGDITAAIAAAAATGVNYTSDVSTILGEPAPTASASVATPSLTKKGSVTLDGSGSSAASVQYEWIELSGPVSVDISGASAIQASVSITVPGDYVFMLTVKNSNGHKSASAKVTISATFAADDVAKGWRALATKDYSAAQQRFDSAYATDPANADAALWSSILDLAAISTDKGMVAFMRDRVGLSDYPSSMTTLFSSTWFNSTWYTMKSDGSHTLDLDKPIKMPSITAPSWLKIPDADKNNLSSYVTILVSSIVDRNPTGLNAAADAILSGAYGAEFDAVYAKIQKLDDGASTVVPNDLLTAYGLPAQTPSLTIEGRELKIVAEQMLAQRGLVEYLDSYQLTYPLRDLMKLAQAASLGQSISSVDIDNPIESGFLSDRENGMRSTARSDLNKALETFSKTAALFDDAVCAKYASKSVKAADVASTCAQASSVAKSLSEALYVKTEVSITPTGSSTPTVMKLDFEPLFVGPFLGMDKLFAIHGSYGAAGSGFVIYGAPDKYSQTTVPQANGSTCISETHTPVIADVGPWDATKHSHVLLKLTGYASLKTVYDGMSAIPGVVYLSDDGSTAYVDLFSSGTTGSDFKPIGTDPGVVTIMSK